MNNVKKDKLFYFVVAKKKKDLLIFFLLTKKKIPAEIPTGRKYFRKKICGGLGKLYTDVGIR